ncbi:MAG: universal stress protein [Candidatus Binatia bacterium]|nr:universal stress protein [Candidatus Binatia bacterium]
MMKLLIAYDGSPCAEAALDDLRRAGLPSEAEVIVLSVADVWMPPAPPEGEQHIRSDFEARIAAARQQARTQALQAVEEARALAARASERLQAYFPDWTVHPEACADSPAWGIVRKADEWQPDLVVVGSHGRSALERVVLGSVSQKVLTAAHCSVRIGRGRGTESGSPVRVVIGVDGSPGADAAVRAVAGRLWRPGSEARVIAVLDATLLATAMEWVAKGDAEAYTRVQTMVDTAAETLRAAGFIASSLVREGEPKQVLVTEAEDWGADCIFVGARGLRGLERFLLGSVSAAVAARAHCSVEVVRPRAQNT